MLSDRRVFLMGESHISPLAVVGAPGEDKRKGVNPVNRGVEVYQGAVIREFCTVHGGFLEPTRIGRGCYLMAHSHVGHDCDLGPDATLSTGATLGGHTRVHEGANLGLNATTHQHVTIGAYAMVGAGAVVLDDVPPFETWAGVPARKIGWNTVGMQRAGFSDEEIADVCEGRLSGRASQLRALFDVHAGRRGR